ncbi:FMRFamide peptide receptor frpr-18-like [Mercenaria mercenaria]|uniref:FMRFamide peptide receptor frpr-18-like n=1 Tax=Mercenaria mercenaria TaxID=6596 RepID=UPI00234F36C8|nr:FMRFamide peptide receptor frpr-18-like [Mercenaria mercenaria]
MYSIANRTVDSRGINDSLENESFDSSITAITLVERFAMPVICILGLIGNTLSFIVFLHKSLRQKSCSLYLAARSLSDNGFILILLVVWISTVLDLRLSKVMGICQSIIFLTYVFGCVSVWLVVFVTFENYIRICKPYRVKNFCKTSNAKYAVIFLSVCVLCCYNFPLWTMNKECLPNEKHYGFIKVMVYTDSLLTLVFPTLIMSGLMTHIAITSITSCKFRRRLSSTSVQKKRTSPMTKVTSMLLAVTLIFFILNMPSHVVRLRLMILAFTENKRDITESLDVTLQSVSQLIYYLSLAVNIFVYYCFGNTFRKVFFKRFHWKTRHTYVLTDSSVLSVQTRLKNRKNKKKFRKIPAQCHIQLNNSADAEDVPKVVHLQ